MSSQQLDQMFHTIATQDQQPEAAFRSLESIVNNTIGVLLFTMMEIDHARGVAWRNYSNMPDAYPVSGEKPLQQNSWSEIVQVQQQIFVANSIEEIADVFPDHELIQKLGCESCINVPIVIGGRVRGTLNCLHKAGHYTPARVVAAQTLKPAGTLAFLMSAANRPAGAIHA